MNNQTRAFLDRSITGVELSGFPWKIGPDEKIFFAGSCFASHFQDYWKERFLPGQISPFGNTYNPESLEETFALLLSGRKIEETELFFHLGLWRHSLFDTARTSPDKEELLTDLNARLDKARTFLKGCSYVVATMGTAWVYRDRETGKTVNNCHKRPGRDFNRILLQADNIAKRLTGFYETLSASVPGIRFILSLSPVRHLRDGAEENSLSKALLRCGLDRLIRENAACAYFPSYEIMTDELRDYRWYAEDLIHPSGQAVRYIMERFCHTAGSPALLEYFKEAEKLRLERNHRIRFPDSPEGRQFRQRLEDKTREFRKAYPYTCIAETEALS